MEIGVATTRNPAVMQVPQQSRPDSQEKARVPKRPSQVGGRSTRPPTLLRPSPFVLDVPVLARGLPDGPPEVFLGGRAVAQESRAVEDREHLKKAKTYYEEVVSKYENSAEADFARKRLEVLKDDAKRQELSATYSQLQSLLGIPAPVQAPKFNDLPGFPDLGKEKK